MEPGQEKRQFLSQESILRTISKNSAQFIESKSKMQLKPKFNGAFCMYFDGLYQYFNTHYK